MRSWKYLLLLVLLSAGFAAPAFAQKTTGDITGTVADSTGGLLPGVTVTLTGPALQQVRRQSDRHGRTVGALPLNQ